MSEDFESDIDIQGSEIWRGGNNDPRVMVSKERRRSVSIRSVHPVRREEDKIPGITFSGVINSKGGGETLVLFFIPEEQFELVTSAILMSTRGAESKRERARQAALAV